MELRSTTSTDGTADRSISGTLAIVVCFILLSTSLGSVASAQGPAEVWVDAGPLVPSEPGGDVGWGVDLSGETAAIGVRDHVEVFEKIEGAWLQTAELAPPGSSEALAIDDGRIVVGTPGTNAAHVYERASSGAWVKQATWSPDGLDGDALFGWAVAVDDGTAAVSALLADEPAVYVYEMSQEGWSQVQVLTSPSGPTGQEDWFGWSLGVSGDHLAVGELKSNAVHTFVRSSTGWEHEALIDSPAPGRTNFGRSLGLVGDRLVVGAPGIETAYVFEQASGSWSQVAELGARDLDPSGQADGFGSSVDVAGDRVIVGAPGDDGTPGAVSSPREVGVPCVPVRVTTTCQGPGSAYVFSEQGEGWQQSAKLHGAGLLPRDGFGAAVALSPDTAIVGAPGDLDRVSGLPGGSVHAFLRLGGSA